MKKIILFVLCLILVCGVAFADDLCQDSDGGREYGKFGKTKYGITEQEDRCVMGPGAEVRVETSMFLMEYYCTNDDRRKSEVVDCSREGYEQCYQGRCVGGAGNGDNDTTTTVPELPKCGDKKINAVTEECDPPGKICYTDDFDIGLCDDLCKCDVKLKGYAAPANVTEENVTEPEEPEEEEKEEIPVIEPEPEEPEVEEPVEIEPEVTVPEKIEKPKPKGFFSRLWAWFKGLFS